MMIGYSNRVRAVLSVGGVRCSSVVRAFAHGAMGRRINPSWGGPIELKNLTRTTQTNC